jgi:hypothetical protein
MAESRWLRSAAGARDQSLYVPMDLFAASTRQVTTAGFPIGLETFGASNLRTWSACLRADAGMLTGLQRNCNVWAIGALPVPQ